MDSVTQSEIVALVAKDLGISERQTLRFLRSYHEALLNSLATTSRLRLERLGILFVRWNASREIITPTKGAVTVPGRFRISLRPSSALKRVLERRPLAVTAKGRRKVRKAQK